MAYGNNTDYRTLSRERVLSSLEAGLQASKRIFTHEFTAAISGLCTRRFISLYATDQNDTQVLDTSAEIWKVVSGGTHYSLDFERLYQPVGRSELLHADEFVQFIKWASARFLSSYSAGYTYKMVLAAKELVRNISSFETGSCLSYLRSAGDRELFYPLKRLIALCCEYDLPGFSVDDLYLLDELSPPVGPDYWQAYYDLEIKLKPAILRFVEMGIGRDINRLGLMSTSDLLGLASLVLCLETGMRPTQLYKLKEEDFRNRDFRYFSITVPAAKQAKRVARVPFELDLSPEAGSIIAELLNRSRPDLANGQLLRRVDGDISLATTFDGLINSRLRAWAARNFVGPMPENAELKDFLRHLPHLTAYDFRHHVGHSLAMSGASADQIARVLGHSSTVAARHYIAATPELAVIKQKALGENAAYQEMMGMILTGEIGEESDWRGRKVAGMVDNRLFTGIGGCSSSSCDFEPVRSCYGCSDFNPFLDGDHAGVRDALKAEAASQLAISDAAGQTHRNPAVLQLEGVIAEVQVVINHCKHRKGCQ